MVVYCAHAEDFDQELFDEYARPAEVALRASLHGEACKSLGLVERLIAEADRPACDVFWNNELLGTMDLAARGLLEPYRGAAWRRMPAEARNDDGRWVAFAARLRVVLVNTARMVA